MLAPFIICLREGIEIFLVIIPLVVYFNKNKMYGMSKSALQGGALGTFMCNSNWFNNILTSCFIKRSCWRII